MCLLYHEQKDLLGTSRISGPISKEVCIVAGCLGKAPPMPGWTSLQASSPTAQEFLMVWRAALDGFTHFFCIRPRYTGKLQASDTHCYSGTQKTLVPFLKWFPGQWQRQRIHKWMQPGFAHKHPGIWSERKSNTLQSLISFQGGCIPARSSAGLRETAFNFLNSARWASHLYWQMPQ